MHLEIVDHISDPGTPGKTNDDARVFRATMAAVFDGATGLADEPLFPDEPSDAAWLARLAADSFAAAPDELPATDIVADICKQARTAVADIAPLDDLPRWAWPNSSMQSLRVVDGRLEISGLGDSVLYLLSPQDELTRYSGVVQSRDSETRAAQSARQMAGGAKGPLLREGPVLEMLRLARSRLNQPGGVWTLGLEPAAAENVTSARMDVVAGTRFLLATDGFSALAEAYDRYDPRGLIAAGFEHGLPDLIAELRDVERNVDPDSERFPRFKQSDDATAILGEIVAGNR